MRKPEPGPRLAYSVLEACQMTSLSRWTLWKLVKSGELQTRKVGRRKLIVAESLEKFIKHGKAA
jgi:excisionase family DNA binding protein